MDNYLHDLLVELKTPENLAGFITTVFGIFIGFLLSSRQYARQKKKEQNQLELKYTRLIKEEMLSNLRYIKIALNDITEKIPQQKFQENDIPDHEINILKEAIKGITQYLKSTITDRALLSAVRMGALQPIMIDNISRAYDCYEVAINAMAPYQVNIEAGKVLANKHGY